MSGIPCRCRSLTGVNRQVLKKHRQKKQTRSDSKREKVIVKAAGKDAKGEEGLILYVREDRQRDKRILY